MSAALPATSPINTDPRRLTIFLPSFAGGGAERSLLTLATGFIERGHRVDLVVVRAVGPLQSLAPEGARLIDLNAGRAVRSVPALTRYLRQVRPDALISTLDFANVIALCARRLARVPTTVVVVEQNTISITTRQSSRLRQKLIPRLLRLSYPWADHVIGNSQGVADDLSTVTGLPQGRIKVIYNPVVTPDLWAKARVPSPHPWLAAGEPPVLLGVGRLTHQKDFVTLIEAFARVRRDRAVRLMILGEGPDRPTLEALIRDRGLQHEVCLPGFVANPYAYMAHAAVFVLSSRWEGLPTVLIEALACGTRVVSTDCPSGPREILAAGRYGPLVPVQNVNALADAIAAAVAGTTPRPAPESWHPYALDTVLDQYLGLVTRTPVPFHAPATDAISAQHTLGTGYEPGV